MIVLTPSIVVQVSETLGLRWKARCPLCKDAGRPKVWTAYAPTRFIAEKKLHRHLDTHNTEEGELL